MKAQRIRTVLRGFILIHLLALNVRAQVYETYNLNWFTLDGGGGSSAGGLLLNGTIGQPDAGAMTGGIFTIAGGF